MYVRGYLHGSENGRVVTIERVIGKFTTMFTLSQSGADQRNKARQFVIIRFTCTLVKKILVSSDKYAYFITSMAYNNFIKLSESLKYTLQ